MWTYSYTYPNYICHHGIKGMKWGIRRTPAQLGHKASPKHRDATGRRDYASARIAYRREKKKEDYDKRLAKDKKRYKNNPEKLKRAKENYKTKMERIDTAAKTSAALREVGKIYVGNLARSTAYNVGSTFALTAVLAANPAVWPVAAGAAYAASIGVTGTNIYKTYQGIRNTYSIATSKKKKQAVDAQERAKKQANKDQKKVNKHDEEAEIWKALAAGNVQPANDSSTLRGVVKDLIDDRRRR